ncbi:hypothetical protein ACSBR1_019060 [Camellia fascicularis]
MKTDPENRISDFYTSCPARAAKPPLERHSQIPARAAKLPLERRMHAPRTFADRSPARASNSPLERTTLHREKYWMGEIPARAPKPPPLERTSNRRSPLERQTPRSSGQAKIWATSFGS